MHTNFNMPAISGAKKVELSNITFNNIAHVIPTKSEEIKRTVNVDTFNFDSILASQDTIVQNSNNSINNHSNNGNTENVNFFDDVVTYFSELAIAVELKKMDLNLKELSEIINYNLTDIGQIKAIVDCGPNNEYKKVVVELEDGTIVEYLLIPYNDTYQMTYIKAGDYGISTEIDDKAKQEAKNALGLDDSVDILGVTYINKDGKTIPVYWTSDLSLEEYLKFLESVNSEIDNYLSSIPEYGKILGIAATGKDSKDRLIAVELPDINSKEPVNYSFLFSYENGEYKLSSISSDGYTMLCNITEEMKQKIREMGIIDENYEITGVAYIKGDGYTYPVYCVGDVSIEEYFDCLKAVDKALKMYPSNIIERIIEDGTFSCFFVGYEETSKIASPETSWHAYTSLYGEAIHIDADKGCDYTTILHELAHVLDHVLGKNYENGTFSAQWLDFYYKYKSILAEIAPYGSGSVPNYKEFFAQVLMAYFDNPEDIKTIMPDLYDAIIELLNSI